MSLLASLERRIARLQGKGWGAQSVDKEVAAAARFMSDDVRLCVDIGGNKGHYTSALLNRFPDAQIIVFEPSPTNIDQLNQKFGSNPKVTLKPFAVAGTAGEAALFSDTPGSGLASLSKRDLRHFNIEFDHQDLVQTIRFEDYWREDLSSPEIDLVKLDIEGHELSALQGFGAAIAHVKVIQFEFGGCNIDTRTFVRDFWHFFSDNGFDLYLLGPLGAQRLVRYREAMENFATANYFAVRRD